MNVIKKIWPLAFQEKNLAGLLTAIALQGALMYLVYWATSWMIWPWIEWFAITLRWTAICYFSGGVVFAFLNKFNVIK